MVPPYTSNGKKQWSLDWSVGHVFIETASDVKTKPIHLRFDIINLQHKVRGVTLFENNFVSEIEYILLKRG